MAKSLKLLGFYVFPLLYATTYFRFPSNLLFNNSEYWHLITIGDMPEGTGFSKFAGSTF